jgi:hypothetical protein
MLRAIVQDFTPELKKGFNLTAETLIIFGRPGGDRTPDQLIKSQLLYQLSYWPMI